jgi:CheY-like chemotaxis protein
MLEQIVIVDDHDSDLLFGRIMVERSNVAALVTTFEDARDALHYLQQPEGRNVGLVLLDINMPGMNGFGFLSAFEQLRGASASPAVVVMLTSSPDPHDRERAFSFAAVRDVMVKPLDEAQVRGVVQRVFGQAAAPPDAPDAPAG